MKIAQEDQQETAVKEQKKVQSRVQMIKFQAEVKQKQADSIAQEKDELDRIEEFARKKREFEEQVEAQKAEAELEKVRILNNMLGVMEARDKEKEELEQLRNDVHMEELEAASRRREEAQKVKHVQARKEMHVAYVQQMEMKQ